MTLKLTEVTFIFMSIHTWSTAFRKPDGDELKSKAVMQYHSNMSTMWMTDGRGRPVKVYLRGNSHVFGYSAEESIFYFLYTREYNSAYGLNINDQKGLASSTFNSYRPTVVLVHGFWNSYQSDVVNLIREAYLNHYDVNILAVDWGRLAHGPWYVEAVAHTETVGVKVASMIDFLVSAGANLQRFHLVGHSLGAHVVAFASNHITSGRITRITGLDPALPLFWFRPPADRLDPSDADQIDCIHTCGGYLGFYVPLCTHDFYPNGGIASQPGCNWDVSCSCSHSRSYRYFSASLAFNFTAYRCSDIDELKHVACNGLLGLMGGSRITTQPGIYYLETVPDYPYIKPRV